ncbi:ATP-grasp domain-containing protein [Antarcticirhabdus aurantiaca]|uniref:RimK family alpha-L-glutamate ligase n=1 Tax=Antarcticirhabdus aurantiaca TaxID=2606717 RepID=A0ACD4NJ46_9HYPH|nr:RimK family alpha-L-glutamate ligase [Antarcticirhabdus aurantiaca]WAJ26788.1 RimK family alpha-L-glutamate ligase [Jeongeuplla avenae]
MGTRPRIALVSADSDSHERQLLAAFADLGAEARPVRLAAIAFDTGSPLGVRIPGFEDAAPDAVLVRTMDGGSFEAVTRRLGALHALEARGLLVSNAARAIEICVDKSATSERLAQAGLPTPRAWCVESLDEARRIAAADGGPLVLKPLFGAQGKGLRLVRGPGDLPEPAAVKGAYYLQRFHDHGRNGRYADFRYLVSNGALVAAMRREAPDWITNVHRGGTPLPAPADPELETLAIAAARAVGADFAGVDLLRDASGRALVIEVNSMPAWTGLRRASGVDVARRRAEDLLARLAERRTLAPAQAAE